MRYWPDLAPSGSTGSSNPLRGHFLEYIIEMVTPVHWNNAPISLLDSVVRAFIMRKTSWGPLNLHFA